MQPHCVASLFICASAHVDLNCEHIPLNHGMLLHMHALLFCGPAGGLYV
jgi:hypothetical protein